MPQDDATHTRPINSNVDVVVIGGLLVDDIAIAAENVKPRSSNPVIWQHRLGGVATNVARVVAQQLGILLIANTGDDNDGKMLSQLLSQQSIASALVIWSNEASDRYTAVLNPDGELFVGLADAQLVERLRWGDIKARLPQQRPSAIVVDANLSEQCLVETLEALDTHYTPRVPVYALAVSPIKSRRWLTLAKRVDVLLCNRREAAALTDLPDESPIDALANGLMAHKFARFVITDASDPVLVQEHNSRTYIPVSNIAIEAAVNGAGDALAGATISELVRGQALPQAVQAGLAASADVLSGKHQSPLL